MKNYTSGKKDKKAKVKAKPMKKKKNGKTE